MLAYRCGNKDKVLNPLRALPRIPCHSNVAQVLFVMQRGVALPVLDRGRRQNCGRPLKLRSKLGLTIICVTTTPAAVD